MQLNCGSILPAARTVAHVRTPCCAVPVSLTPCFPPEPLPGPRVADCPSLATEEGTPHGSSLRVALAVGFPR